MMRFTLSLLAAGAAAVASSQSYSYDGISDQQWILFFGSPNAVAQNTILANLNPITDIDVALYNGSGQAISGATLTVSIYDASASNPFPGGPGNQLFTHSYDLGSIPNTGGNVDATIVSLPTDNLMLPSTNVWTSLKVSSSGLSYLVNESAPTVGSAAPLYFAQNVPGTGWEDNWQFAGNYPPYFGIRYDTAPAPEPASMALLGSLGIAIVSARRKSGRSS